MASDIGGASIAYSSERSPPIKAEVSIYMLKNSKARPRCVESAMDFPGNTIVACKVICARRYSKGFEEGERILVPIGSE